MKNVARSVVAALLLGVATLACGSAGTRRSHGARSYAQSPPAHGSGATQTPGSNCGHVGEVEPAQLAGITAAHNAIRCKVARPNGQPLAPLAWSNALAARAQRYAQQLASNNCAFEHSNTELGENLFGGSGKRTPAEVVETWAGEQRCFSYGQFPASCSCTCGHYTQLVWSETRALGCGSASCTNGGEVWVCNYDPAGNYSGTPPY